MSPPHVPEIKLHLASEAVPLWQRTEEELGEMGLPPPFWAFAWAGGQALARFILDEPERVAGRTCLDFASGSGLVGIAAMKAGASRVVCVDIDAFAIEAMDLNARLNEVSLDVLQRDVIGETVESEIILAGDIFYDRELAERLTAWLQELADGGRTVLIGDPGRAYLPKAKLRHLATYEVPVTRDLEDAEVKKSSVWQLG
ncbi:MAG: methyltransferase [Beijerinckiaceae bacterium]|nr:methyltransferase [Beijerinckiaceae bacterium]